MAYQNCCRKCGSFDLFIEPKGNNIDLYCASCGTWQQWMNKNDIRAFEHNKVTKKSNIQKMNSKNNINFRHEETRVLLNKPYVVLVENEYDEELRINGESVCCHKKLYPFDILDALKNKGIINFTHMKEE